MRFSIIKIYVLIVMCISVCSNHSYAKKATPSNHKQNSHAYYIVQKGDSLSSVAKNHSVSINALANLNNLTNKSNLNIEMKLKIPTQNNASYAHYIVQKGDTLYSVAKNHLVNVNAIANLNNLSNTANLNTGMKLKVPTQNHQNSNNTYNANIKKPSESKKQNANTYYIVKKGDTLYSVSRNHSVSVDALANLNNLNNTASLNVGMKLKIPNSKSSGVESPENNSANLPKFIWPAKNILTFKNDGTAGVKSIGLIIFSKPGSEIISSATGTVKKIGEMHGYGKYIVISHDNRYITVYSNLSGICVKEGEEVNTGKVIALSNNETGKIHFQIDYAGRPTDPLKYLPKRS
jgi:murein DD-endopeptidase MepM/ murein hydrolase activator NlpD